MRANRASARRERKAGRDAMKEQFELALLDGALEPRERFRRFDSPESEIGRELGRRNALTGAHPRFQALENERVDPVQAVSLVALAECTAQRVARPRECVVRVVGSEALRAATAAGVQSSEEEVQRRLFRRALEQTLELRGCFIERNRSLSARTRDTAAGYECGSSRP